MAPTTPTRIITRPDTLPPRSVAATIGMFDGVHLGHLWLIGALKRQAARRNLCSALITFGDHPQNVLRPERDLKLLMPIDERLAALSATGVDYIILMDFTRELSMLDSSGFTSLISGHYGVAAMTVGFNHRFGHNRDESFTDYERNGAQAGVAMEQADEYAGPEAPVSSSIIRHLLQQGDMAQAAAKLGRPFSITGPVVHGFARGRGMGFPTANIQTEPSALVPCQGVYAARITLPDGSVHGGMANIGTHPTFPGGGMSVEAHIFDFHGELYGKTAKVELLARLRDERAMDSAEELRQQLETDRAAALQALMKQ